MPKHGKKYREASKLVDDEKLYQVAEAIPLLRQLNYVTFDPTVELHMQLGVDPRHADQMVRGTAGLPAGTGKSVKVLVFAQGEKATAGQITKKQLREIAEAKMKDLNANDIEAAERIVAGTARSMGITIA